MVLLLAATLVLTLAACGGSDSDDASSASTVPTATSTPTTAGPAASTSSSVPATTTPGPPATRGPQTVVFGPVTFHIPAAWITVPEGATTLFIGENAGRTGHANLRVVIDYTGTVDALQPPECQGDGAFEAKPPASVTVLESGFAPVGNVTAEFRKWRISCPESEVKVEEHRVWLLPLSRVGIVEQRYGDPVGDIVATAEVA